MRNIIHSGTRKAAALLVLAALVLSVAACSGTQAEAEQAAALFVGNLQQQEYGKACAMMKDPESVPLLTVSEDTHPGTAALLDLVCSEMTFAITQVDAGDQQAQVTLDLTVPDVAQMLMAYLRDGLMMSLVDSPQDGLQNALQQLLADKVDDFQNEDAYTKRTATVQLRMVYEENQWKIADTDALEAALISGFDQMLSP